MSDKVSVFWQGVTGHPTHLKPISTSSSSLHEAIRSVVSNMELRASLRHCRELIDVKWKFRRFEYNNTTWIGKITSRKSAQVELMNARHSQKKLSGLTIDYSIPIRVIVPSLFQIDSNTSVLVSQYQGPSLHNAEHNSKRRLSNSQMLEIFATLIKNGIMWKGFCPRNVIVDIKKTPPRYISLVDWEDTSFFDTSDTLKIEDLFLFFIKLNWSPFYNDFGIEFNNFCSKLDYILTTSPLDNFEKCYQVLCGHSDANITRTRCCKITLKSEKPIKKKLSLSPFEAGHFIDENVPKSLSVAYTALSANLRSTHGDSYFVILLNCLTKMLQLRVGNSEGNENISRLQTNVSKDILLHILSIPTCNARGLMERLKYANTELDVYDAYRKKGGPAARGAVEFLLLSDKTGWDAAVRRSESVDKILSGLFNHVGKAIGNKSELELILRGSVAQGLMTTRSDLDFEVSGPKYPDGNLEWESLIIEAVKLLGLESEGSCSRPLFADLVTIRNSKLTRDLHEWMELRKIEGNEHNPGWLRNHFQVSTFQLLQESLYEKEGIPLSPKTLFFRVRTLIARLNFYYGFEFAKTELQLASIERKNNSLSRKLRKLVWASFELYESNPNTYRFASINELSQEISKLSSDLNLSI